MVRLGLGPLADHAYAAGLADPVLQVPVDPFLAAAFSVVLHPAVVPSSFWVRDSAANAADVEGVADAADAAAEVVDVDADYEGADSDFVAEQAQAVSCTVIQTANT